MTTQQELDTLESTIKNMRRHIRPILVENKELKAKEGKVNIFYALTMLVMLLLLLTAVVDDIRLRFVIAENAVLTEQFVESVGLYADAKEAQAAELEGMVLGGADAMTGCADTLNLCNGRASELGVALEKSLGREAQWKSVANECLGSGD